MAFAQNRMPEVRQILAGQFPNSHIQEATESLDQYEATDLVVTTETGAKLHCTVRVRTAVGFRYWPNATFRDLYPDGTESEWSKILAGHGDIMFYGIFNDRTIANWVILDLNKVREQAKLGHVGYGGQNPPDQGGETFQEIKDPYIKETAISAQW